MKEIRTNIWNLHKEGYYAVIPTNLGYNRLNSNIMGAGLAKQAADKYPTLPAVYGKTLIKNPNLRAILFFDNWNLIMFPTKERNNDSPWLSWKNKSSLELIEYNCNLLSDDLLSASYKVAIPLVGCGCGQLDETEVLDILNKYFGENDNVVLVRQAC